MFALVAGSFAAPPAEAGAAPTVVYEIVRAADAPSGAMATIDVAPGPTTFLLTVTLVPTARGYEAQFATANSTEGGSETGRLLLRGGERFLVGGERGRFKVSVAGRGWSVRNLGGNGFRVVAAETPPLVAGVESFGSASAPAGPYGSIAFALVPCDPGVGSWTLAAENEPGRSSTCPLDASFHFLTTERARRWNLDADVYGVRADDVRLAVLDYPRKPR